MVEKTNAKFQDHVDDHACPRVGDYVEIRISPADHQQQFLQEDFFHRFTIWAQWWRDKFKSVDGITDSVYVIEQSQAGQRLHIHGIVRLSAPQDFLDFMGRIRMGATPRRGRGSMKGPTDSISVAVFMIKSKEHLKERLAYLAKDVKVFRHDEYEPVLGMRRNLREHLEAAVSETTDVNHQTDQWLT